MTITRARTRHTDEGFTLPEVVMYSMLLTIVLAVAASIMISGSIAERTVRTVTGASTAAQLAADSIETGIRNSSAFVIVEPTAGTQMLAARVAQGQDLLVWACASWYWSPSVDDGSIWYKTSATAIAAPTSNADLSTWTRLVDEVTPSGGANVFTLSGDHLAFSFEKAAGNDPPVQVSSSSTSRAEIEESTPCF